MKMERRVVIWGAGKIGRGFVAEIFFRGPFQMTSWMHPENSLHASGPMPVIPS